MSITVYHSEGIILSYNDVGEADRVFNIYTKDFGLVSVFAKGIRLQKSKLRYHTTLFSHLRIAFVQGKDILRLTDAEEIKNFGDNSEALSAFARCAELVERMIKGRQEDVRAWNLVLSAHQFLSRTKELPKLFNLLFGVRLLYLLGYVGELPDNLKVLIDNNSWEYFSGARSAQLKQIFEKGLEASHL